MPKLELVLIIKLITIYTLLQTPENNTSPEIANSTVIAKLTQIVQIPTAKILGNILIKANANN